MKIECWMKWAAVVVAACGLAAPVLVHKAQADPAAAAPTQSGAMRGRILEKLAGLGLTEDQRSQIRAILQDAKPKAQPLVKQFVTERRALRALIQNGANETEVRAQAAKVASVGADLAVLRAQVVPKIRAVLTPEQRQKAAEMRAEFDHRVDAAVQDAGGSGQPRP